MTTQIQSADEATANWDVLGLLEMSAAAVTGEEPCANCGSVTRRGIRLSLVSMPVDVFTGLSSLFSKTEGCDMMAICNQTRSYLFYRSQCC